MARCLSVSPSTRTFAYSPFLHLALLALGCQWSNDLRTNDPAVAARLTARAQTALEEEAERPTLSTIQGLLILGHHHSSAGRSVLGNVFVNFGFQTCRRLGLGSDGGTMAPHASLLEDQRCARLRTYWACFILDKCVWLWLVNWRRAHEPDLFFAGVSQRPRAVSRYCFRPPTRYPNGRQTRQVWSMVGRPCFNPRSTGSRGSRSLRVAFFRPCASFLSLLCL